MKTQFFSRIKKNGYNKQIFLSGQKTKQNKGIVYNSLDQFQFLKVNKQITTFKKLKIF